MMKNKKGTIILSIILAVQFIIPLSVWGYETFKNKELEEKGQEVKVLVDSVFCDHRGVVFRNDTLEELMHTRNMHYIVFENNESGFSNPKEISGLPANNLYISANRLYSWYSEDWGFKYESKGLNLYEDYGYVELYDREIEQANIKHGFCEGPETQAYAVFKVYKNRFKVVNVYIDEMPVETVIEKYNNNEFDVSRYEHYHSYDYNKDYEIYYDYEMEDYYKEYYDEELDEYITEPVRA